MEDALRAAVERAPLPMMIHAEDGRILLVNQTWREISGYAEEDLATIRDWVLLAYGDEGAGPVEEVIRTLHARRSPASDGEFVVRCRSGELRTWDFSSLPVGRDDRGVGLVLSVAADVTERARALAALAETEALYRELFRANPRPMWVYELETARFLEVNDAAVASYGYSRDEFLALTVDDLRSDDAPPAHLGSLVRGRPGAGPELPSLRHHRRKDGSLLDVSVSSRELDYAGRPARLVLAEDVTERLKARAEVARLTEQLEQRVRDRTAELEHVNQELETFAYTVSHDLKAPLRAIDGYSRLLEEDHGGALEGEAREFLGNIRAGVARMGSLIDDLLAYSRMERRDLQLRELDIEEIAGGVAAERDAELRRCGGRLELEVAGARAVGDPEAVRLVLRNYLDNAIKFRDPARDPRLTIRATAGDGNTVLSVADNGIGFDMTFHDRIFDIFQRLQRAEDYAGTGIGLAIVRKAAHRMGGRVWAESRPGEGSVFYLEIPR